jgi:hypothetical protein
MTDAKLFCSWLTIREKAAKRLANDQEYRLPTSAEWVASFGMAEKDLGELYPWGRQWPPPSGAGNYLGEEAESVDHPPEYLILSGYRDGYTQTAPVGSFKPNALGIYDLSGNAWELCAEGDDKNLKTVKVRGACWAHGAREPFRLLCTNYMEVDAGIRTPNIGFRLVLTIGSLGHRVGSGDSPAASALADPASTNSCARPEPLLTSLEVVNWGRSPGLLPLADNQRKHQLSLRASPHAARVMFLAYVTAYYDSQ